MREFGSPPEEGEDEYQKVLKSAIAAWNTVTSELGNTHNTETPNNQETINLLTEGGYIVGYFTPANSSARIEVRLHAPEGENATENFELYVNTGPKNTATRMLVDRIRNRLKELGITNMQDGDVHGNWREETE